jgi:hypothetical protein
MTFSGGTEYDETARVAELYLNKTSVRVSGRGTVLLRIGYTTQLTWRFQAAPNTTKLHE